MKELTLIILLIVLSGCANAELFTEEYRRRYGHELAHKCDINPYDPDCLQPRPVYHN
ncbi:hypothetical protein D3C81_905920 [compost metagenome]